MPLCLMPLEHVVIVYAVRVANLRRGEVDGERAVVMGVLYVLCVEDAGIELFGVERRGVVRLVK